jgi:hypothetical protein
MRVLTFFSLVGKDEGFAILRATSLYELYGLLARCRVARMELSDRFMERSLRA